MLTVNEPPVARMSSSVRRVLRSPIAMVGGVDETTLIQATASVSASSIVPPTTSTHGMGKSRSTAPRRFFMTRSFRTVRCAHGSERSLGSHYTVPAEQPAARAESPATGAECALDRSRDVPT